METQEQVVERELALWRLSQQHPDIDDDVLPQFERRIKAMFEAREASRRYADQLTDANRRYADELRERARDMQDAAIR